jgi:hypothetical protein
MQTIKDVNLQSNSTSAVQPISFDSPDQVADQVRRLEQRLDTHVQAASQGKNRAYAEQLTAVIREVSCCHRWVVVVLTAELSFGVLL